MKDFFRRLKALTHKEFLELIRDRSSLLMGILMPMMLVIINGYGGFSGCVPFPGHCGHGGHVPYGPRCGQFPGRF